MPVVKAGKLIINGDDLGYWDLMFKAADAGVASRTLIKFQFPVFSAFLNLQS
jgi:hypothetical protein